MELTLSEKHFTKRVCTEMQRQGAKVTAIVAQSMQEPGIPDRHVSWRGYSWWLEFKDVRTKLKLAQKIWIRENNKRCHNAFVVRAPDRVENEEGELIATFSGKELLHVLYDLSAGDG